MILKFEPYFKPVLWGGNRIATFKDTTFPGQDIGESWEISVVSGFESVVSEGPEKGSTLSQLCNRYREYLLGHRVVERFGLDFPLLVKLIDAKADLSLQVHPDEDLARRRHNSSGKHEMWYIIDCDEDARIFCGLGAPLDAQEYIRRIDERSIMEVVATYSSEPGQAYYIPAGTIHAIGAGNFIAEIQQSSDITYRIYDYDRVDGKGNRRELHTHQASQAINYQYPNPIHPTARTCKPSSTPIVDTPYFTTELLETCPGEETWVDTHGESFVIILVCSGQISLLGKDNQPCQLNQGHTVLISADDKVRITSNERATILKTYIR